MDVCDKCKCSRYCGRNCQLDDWPTHKLLCKSFETFATGKASGKEHYRATVFPEQGAKPQFFWLRMDTRDRSILIDSMLPLTTFIHMAYNSVLKRAHNRNALVGSCYTGSSGNPVLVGKLNIAAGKIEKEFLERGTFKGPLLFHGMMTHLDMLDFRHIVDYMRVQWYDNLMQV
jgi:hypothetical protein